MFTHNSSASLPFLTAGTGPLVVLAHGVTDSAASLADLTARLSDEYRVVAIDSLGHGLARRCTDAELTDYMAAALAEFEATVDPLVQQFGKAVAIGHSMGGALVTRLAALRPELFCGVIAEDPAWLSAEQAESYRVGAADTVAELQGRRQDPSAAIAKNRDEYPSWAESERGGWLAAKMQVDLGMVATGNVGYTDWADWAQTLQVPTVVISSDSNDVLQGPDGLAAIESLGNPNLSTLLIPGTRHSVRRENQDAFDQAIRPLLHNWSPVPQFRVIAPGETPRQGVQPSETASCYIDPELRPALDMPYFPDWDLPGIRARGEANLGPIKPDTPGTSLELIEVPSADGTPVELRVWRPDTPICGYIYSIHGGGFTAGQARYDDQRNAEMAGRFSVCVVSPEYRLAPEFPYPTPAEDCYAGAVWMLEKAQAANLPSFIYGDSAGGGIAEPVTTWLLERANTPLTGLIMIEPFLDPSLSSVSMRRHDQAQMWNRTKAYWGWQCYLDQTKPKELARLITQVASPNFPRVMTVVASADALRDEGIRWATDLVDAGANVELHLMPGTFHAGLSMDGTQVWARVKQLMDHFMALPDIS